VYYNRFFFAVFFPLFFSVTGPLTSAEESFVLNFPFFAEHALFYLSCLGVVVCGEQRQKDRPFFTSNDLLLPTLPVLSLFVLFLLNLHACFLVITCASYCRAPVFFPDFLSLERFNP